MRMERDGETTHTAHWGDFCALFVTSKPQTMGQVYGDVGVAEEKVLGRL